MPSFIEIGPPVLEKKKGFFLPYMGMAEDVCWFPLPIDATYKIWLWLAKRFQGRRSLKMVDDGRTDDDDGRSPGA